MNGHVAVAVGCGLIAAIAYALSNVLQQREAEQLADEDAMTLGLLAKLAHRPGWVIGISADVVGYVFEALALGAGTLVLVEPMLATALVFSLLFGSIIRHRRVLRDQWIAAVLLAASVSLFLAQVKPVGGDSVAPTRRWLVAGLLVIGFIALCVSAAARQTGARRAALLSAGAGVAFGTSAVLTKAFVHYLGQSPTAWIPHWEPYGLAVCSIGGLVLAQSAFQTGALAASVGAEQVMQPLAGVVLGVALLGEQISAADLLDRLVAMVALAAMLWCVTVLARVEAESHTELLVPEPTCEAD